MKRGNLFVLSAPSGAGKTSLAKALVGALPNLAFSISHTTRPPRPGEEDGVDYYFVNEGQFQEMIEDGMFLEHAYVFDHRYGTSREVVERLLAAGKDVVFDVDWQGAHAIKQQMPQASTIFILPPSREVLEARLAGRGQDARDVIERRMQTAVSEMKHYREFDYLVVNDDFAAALEDLKAIVRGDSAGPRRPAVDIARLLGDS